MSFLSRVLGLDAPASPDLPVDPHAALPVPTAADTESVRLIAAQLSGLPPARARLLAAAAYLLGRAANADLAVTDAEVTAMTAMVERVTGFDADSSRLIVRLANAQSGEYGPTEDYLVTREFKAISTMEERQRLLRACFVVMAADDEIDETESWLANRMAEELDIERPDLNRIREEFHEQLSGVRAVRKLSAS
jgi:uncharacterized tellurite resistance protein B-like protein